MTTFQQLVEVLVGLDVGYVYRNAADATCVATTPLGAFCG